jgi:hypothetical protein
LALAEGEQLALPQQEFQKTDLSVEIPISSDNDKLKVATAVRQIMRELSESVSKEDKVMIVTMIVLDLNKLRGFSPQANYTDRATAACRRS